MKKFTFAALAVPLMWVLPIITTQNVYAQEHTMTLVGKVQDANGPLEGVTVWQVETNNATLTDDKGYYTLEVIKGSDVQFEMIGYKTQTYQAVGNIRNVTLVADEEILDEIVINAGYYTVKDKERTGSISKITAKEIGQQPVANPLAAMQGRMAGVNITQSSGTPGGGFDIQIRGRNSLRTEGNAPLYIVDGVPYGSQTSSNGAISSTTIPLGNVSPLNSINPNDIESIEVLKDADATAIYGSRGSNGVVLITTKKGSIQGSRFSINSSLALSSIGNYIQLMNTEQYLIMRTAAFTNDGIKEYPANAYDVNGAWDPNRNTDWQKILIGNTASIHNIEASLRGGDRFTNYVVSVNNREESTVFYGDSKYVRKNVTLNFGHQSKNERFKFSISNAFSNQRNKLPANDLTRISRTLAPNAPELFTSDGSLNWENNTFENPLASLENTYVSKSNQVISNMNFHYDLTTNFKLKLNLGYTNFSQEEMKKLPSSAYNPSLGIGSERSSVYHGDLKRESWLMEPQMHYDFENGNSRWNAIVGLTFEELTNNNQLIYATNFSNNHFLNNLSAAQTLQVVQDFQSTYKYNAVFGRLNYIYSDKYILNLTGRRDGSSRFGERNRFANFGALGSAWLISKENFLKNSSQLSFLKLRFSYGITGSDLIGDYQYLDTYSSVNSIYDGIGGLVPSRLYNPNFSWENNKKLEVGIESSFFNNIVGLEMGWYRNRSSNQLVGIPLPGTTGFTSITSNLDAIVENSGVEILLRIIALQTDKVNWKISSNFTKPKNVLLKFPNLEESTYANRFEIGESIYAQKLYNYLGINPITGAYEFEDYNKDGIITASEDKEKWMFLGVKYYGGLTSSFQFDKWNFDMTWQYVNQTNYNPIYNSSLLGMLSNQPVDQLDYWSSDNPSGKFEGPTTGANRESLTRSTMFRESSAMIVDASYVRLKNVNFSYQLNFKSNIDVVLFVQGQNLLTITKYKGMDPEFQTTGYIPPLRTISFGCNLNL